MPAVLRHPRFAAIPLHSDEELLDLLGAAVVDRVDVHAWPLSRVQRLELADGRRLAYKSQLPPTVEPDFYAAATSPLLPGFRDLGRAGAARIMALDWLDAPLLAPDDRLAEHGRALVEQISAIGGSPPAYVDIGSLPFLRLQWAVEGQVDLFPGHRIPLLDSWAADAAGGIAGASG
jgi:hypothetical protein